MRLDSDSEESLRKLWRRLRGQPALRRLLRGATGEVEVAYAGGRWHLVTRDNHTDFVLWLNGKPPEHEATQWFCQKFANQPVRFVDVGANAGLFSLPIALAASAEAKFVMLEPNPTMAERARRNMALNDLETVVLDEVAVGPTRGTARLTFAKDGNLGGASLVTQGDSGIDVPVVPLFEQLLTHKLDRIDVMKVDIEGYEDQAVVPFLESAPDGMFPGMIYFEDTHNDRWQWPLVERLTDAGYTLSRRFGENAVYVREG